MINANSERRLMIPRYIINHLTFFDELNYCLWYDFYVW